VQHVRDRGPLDVEDLAADRQQRLELGVARALGGAQRGVAFDDEQLTAVVPDLPVALSLPPEVEAAVTETAVVVAPVVGSGPVVADAGPPLLASPVLAGPGAPVLSPRPVASKLQPSDARTSGRRRR